MGQMTRLGSAGLRTASDIKGTVHATMGLCHGYVGQWPHKSACTVTALLGCGLCVGCWDALATVNENCKLLTPRTRARYCESCKPPPEPAPPPLPRYEGQCEALGCRRPSSYLTSQVVLSGARRWLSVCKLHEHKIAVLNAEAAGLPLSWERLRSAKAKAEVLV